MFLELVSKQSSKLFYVVSYLCVGAAVGDEGDDRLHSPSPTPCLTSCISLMTPWTCLSLLAPPTPPPGRLLAPPNPLIGRLLAPPPFVHPHYASLPPRHTSTPTSQWPPAGPRGGARGGRGRGRGSGHPSIESRQDEVVVGPVVGPLLHRGQEWGYLRPPDPGHLCLTIT